MDLAFSMNYALEKMGFAGHPVDAYRKFVGDGIVNEARRALPPEHLGSATVEKAIKLARGHYSRHWVDHTRVYPGVGEMLDALEERKMHKAILSNKPDDFTKLTVEKLLGEYHFDHVQGLGEDFDRKPSPNSALRIAGDIDIAPTEFLYLGDTDTDMKTAVAAGMYPVGALWGFRTAEELKENGARELIHRPVELLKLLDTNRRSAI